MEFVHISPELAFSPGRALWLAPDPSASRLAELLDWRLHFLAARASARARAEISPQLREVAERCGYVPPEISPDEAEPLLIESGRFVPARATAIVAWRGDGGAWAAAARRAWERMGRPDARAFLPAEMKAAAFEAAWAKSEGRVEIVGF